MPLGSFLHRSLLCLLLASVTQAQFFDYLKVKVNSMLGGNKATDDRPPILIGCFPQFSHVEKVVQLAGGLVQMGYPVYFMSGPLYKDVVEFMGAKYIEIPEAPTTLGFLLPDHEMKELMSLKPGSEEQQLHVIGKAFVQTIPRNFRAVQRTLRQIDDARTIYIQDMMFTAAGPLLRGAPGIRPHSIITVANSPHTLPSNDTFPWNSGRVPDTSPNSREIHRNALVELGKSRLVSGWWNMAADAWKEVRAQAEPPFPPTDSSALTDILCAMTIPDFEFPRSDLKTDVRFIGMTEKVGVPDRKLPSWWNEVAAAKKAGKKIVAISRSSIDLTPNAVIVPTIEALKDREDVFIIATLTNQEPEEFAKHYEIPKNVHLERFIPMDLMLPEIDLLVTNAGYGTVQHALRNGVPLVLSGAGEDKGQTGAIAAYTGVGEYHHKNILEVAEVKVSVDKVLKEPSFKKAAQKMRHVYAEYHPVEALHNVIQERVQWYNSMTAEPRSPKKDEL